MVWEYLTSDEKRDSLLGRARRAIDSTISDATKSVESAASRLPKPQVQAPKLELPKIDLPDIDLPDLSLDIMPPIRSIAGDIGETAGAAARKIGQTAGASANVISDVLSPPIDKSDPDKYWHALNYRPGLTPKGIFSPEEERAVEEWTLSNQMPGSGMNVIGRLGRAGAGPNIARAAANIVPDEVKSAASALNRKFTGRPRFMGDPTKSEALNQARVAAQEAIGSNFFVKPLREIEELVEEVKTAPGWARGLIGAINPSAKETRQAGKLGVAGMRQQDIARRAADEAVATALDTFDTRFGVGRSTGPGGAIFDIDDTGIIRNVRGRDQSASGNWMDVFSNPGKYELNAAQQQYVDVYNRLPQEIENVRVAAGLDPRATDLDEGVFYVPRQVLDKNGLPPRRQTNPGFRRHYELAEEGVQNGINYLNDPKEVMRLHMRAALEDVARKQVDEGVRNLYRNPNAGQILDEEAGTVEPDFMKPVTPSMLVPGDIIQRRRDARMGMRFADAEIAREREVVINSRRQAAVDLRDANNRVRDAERTLARVRGVFAGRSQTATGRRQTPISLGQELADAQAALDEARLVRDELRTAAQDIPRFTNIRGDVGTTIRSQRQYAESLREYNAARAEYSRAVQEARGASWADAKLFGLDEAGDVEIRLWRNNFILKDDYEALARTYGDPNVRSTEQAGAISEKFAKLGNVIRYISASGDFSMPFNQGLLVLGTDPRAWAKLTAKHFQAFVDPSVISRYLDDNREIVSDAIRNGLTLDNEIFAASQKGGGFGLSDNLKQRFSGPLGVARGLQRQTLGRTEAAYTAGMTVGRIELYKALYNKFPDKNELVQFVNNATGGLNPVALGIGKSQRNFESTWMAFSPRLIRSTTALFKDAANLGDWGPAAVQSRKTLVSLALGTMATYYAVGKAIGRPDAELQEGMNPLNGKRFLSYNINGDWVGVGGQTRALIQLTAKVGAAGFEASTGIPTRDVRGEFDRFESLRSFGEFDQRDNPALAFIASRGAPGVSLVQNWGEAITGQDVNPYKEVNGIPGAVAQTALSAVPFVGQNLIEGQRGETALLSAFGARTSPPTPTDRLNQVSQRDFGTRQFRDLDPTQQEAIRTQNPDLARQYVEKGSPELKRYTEIKDQYTAEQLASDQRLARNEIKNDTWREQFSGRRDKLRAAREAIYGPSDPSTTRNPTLRSYYQIVQSNRLDDGTVDWDKVDLAVIDAGLDQQYIDRETGLGWTPAVKAYREKQKQARPFMEQYMDMPRYRGLSTEEGQQAQDLIEAARSLEIIEGITYRKAVNQLAREYGVSGRIKTRALRPQGWTNKARARFWKKHPILEETYGSLAPREVVAAVDLEEEV